MVASGSQSRCLPARMHWGNETVRRCLNLLMLQIKCSLALLSAQRV